MRGLGELPGGCSLCGADSRGRQMKIEKRSYSSSPWRLIDNNGREVNWQRPMKHPDLGATWVNEPVMGVTKAECTERVLELLGLCFARLNAGVAINPASGNPRPDERAHGIGATTGKEPGNV